jgi:chemotaxis response regulator CheB
MSLHSMIAQSLIRSTSVVYGMPREAVAVSAAAQVLPLTAIADAMLDA